MVCPWCINNPNGCFNKDELTCDFKTLPMEPIAVKKRMDDERETVVSLAKANIETKEELWRTKAEIKDRMEGVMRMKKVYEEKFNMTYAPSNQMEFTKVFLDFMIKGKKIERGK